MGRTAKTPPNEPEDIILDDDDDGDDNDDDQGLVGGGHAPRANASALKILEKVMAMDGDGTKKSGGVDMMQIMLMKMQADEERAREDRRSRETNNKTLVQLAIAALPMLVGFFKKEADPIMAQLLGTVLNGSNNREQLEAMMKLSMQANSEQIKMALQGFSEISKLKDEANREIIEKVKENAGGGDGKAGGFADTLREVRLAMEALKGVNLGTAPAPVLSDREQELLDEGRPEGDKPLALPLKEKPIPPVLSVLRMIMRVHQDEGLDKAGRANLKMEIVRKAMEDQALTDALDSEDEEALQAVCGPAFVSDAKLVTWVQMDGVAYWLQQYVKNQIVPMVQEAMIDDNDMDDAGGEGDADDDHPEAPTQPAVPTAGLPKASAS